MLCSKLRRTSNKPTFAASKQSGKVARARAKRHKQLPEAPIEPHVSRSSRDLWLRAGEKLSTAKTSGKDSQRWRMRGGAFVLFCLCLHRFTPASPSPGPCSPAERRRGHLALSRWMAPSCSEELRSNRLSGNRGTRE